MSRTQPPNVDNGYVALQRTMTDARGHEVVFVSHCLLNQNTRYLGGAVCPGVVASAVMSYLESGAGIVQMPCPEQRVWGGVLKRRLLWLLLHPRCAQLSLPLMSLVERYIGWRYARLAHRLVREVSDYTASGFNVCGVVGVAGSPSCGVHTTMNLRRAAAAIAQRPGGEVTDTWFNRAVVEAATCPGGGLFVNSLAKELSKRRQDVPFGEVSLQQPARGWVP